MTHYYTSYAGLSGERKRKQALLDTREYVGRERYAKLRDILRRTKLKEKEGFDRMEYWDIALSFAGISGYPVKALVVSYAPDGKEIAK